MPKRATPAKINKKHMTKAEKAKREELENIIAGELSPEPPDGLTEERAEIYIFIVNTLKDSGLLKSLDFETVLQACIIIDRLHQIDQAIDLEGFEKSLLTARNQLFSQYLKIADLLCMSPTARAKVGTLATNTKEQDPLIELLDSMDGDEP